MRWQPPDTTLEAWTVTMAIPSGGVMVAPRAGWLLGYTLTEPTGTAPATVQLYDGSSATAQALDVVTIPEGGTVRWNPGTPGTPLERGLGAIATAGTAVGTFTVGAWA